MRHAERAKVTRSTERWPALPLDAWEATYQTLHRWTQILGKTRLALAPAQNHWWHAALYLSPRGLTTSPMPYADRWIELELDVVHHAVVAATSEGAFEAFPLRAMAVADFYQRYRRLLATIDAPVAIRPVPSEMLDRTSFEDDRQHASYDPEAAHRCWRALGAGARVLAAARGAFLGKSSPVHFWWGGFDLACTLFSGRRAPEHPGGVPGVPDHVVREAYSHECASVGWWPGGGMGDTCDPPVREPAFYAYAAPEPDGYARAAIEPDGAYYHPTLHEWILPYAVVRAAPDPDRALRAFCDSTYAAVATLGRWDRAALERAGQPEMSATRSK